MTRDTHRQLASIIGSLALGAVAMYAFDPDKGRGRRAVARDKAYSLMLDTRHAAAATRRDVAHRLEGLQARARRMWTTGPTADDLKVIERVRARIGRMVAHPHAIQVGALGGRVTLSGPVLEHEAAALVASTRSVWGVHSVENLLVIHDDPASVPSLQDGGDADPPASHERWTPALRAAALSGGLLLALLGIRQRSLTGVAMMTAAAGLGVRSITDRSFAALLASWREDEPTAADTNPEVTSDDEPLIQAALGPDDDEDGDPGRALH